MTIDFNCAPLVKVYIGAFSPGLNRGGRNALTQLVSACRQALLVDAIPAERQAEAVLMEA